MDIQVYSSKEKASVTVDGEVVSTFLNGVRCLQFNIYTVLSVSSIYGPVAKQADHKSTVKKRIPILIQFGPRKAINKVN